MSDDYVLVLYYSRHGAIEKMAMEIARGIEQDSKMQARLRTVPEVSCDVQGSGQSTPQTGAIYCTQDDLRHCSGLVLGSPSHFGNMAAPLKHFIDTTSALWMTGALVDKPASAFTASSSLHGGQESTLLNMLIPLLHHGMLFCGLPYSESNLATSQTGGGTPYGASHHSGFEGTRVMDEGEIKLCRAQGRRMARLARMYAA